MKEIKNESTVSNRYLADNIFLARIELGTFVDVISTRIAANAHGKHHPNIHLLVLRLRPSWNLRRIEIRRVVFIQNLSFSHIFFFPSFPPLDVKLGCCSNFLGICLDYLVCDAKRRQTNQTKIGHLRKTIINILSN